LILKDLFPCLAISRETSIKLPSNFHRSLSVSTVHCATFSRNFAACWEQFGDALYCRSPNFRFSLSMAMQENEIALRKPAKEIVALADSFRKLLSFQILASSTTFSCSAL